MHIEILKSIKLFFSSNFRQNHSPSLRLALGDKLFLHHLKLLVEQPSKKHLNQLQNRFLTLRSRRTDEVSSRFFLRDWAVNPPPHTNKMIMDSIWQRRQFQTNKNTIQYFATKMWRRKKQWRLETWNMAHKLNTNTQPWQVFL